MNPAPPVTSAVPPTDRQRSGWARRRLPLRFTRKRYPYEYPTALRGRYIGDKMKQDGVGDAVGQREDTMSGHRRRVAVAAASCLALLCVGSAYAATPQRIYRDLADNGKLDGRYTRAEVEQALTLPKLVGTDARLPRRPLVETRELSAAPPPKAPADDRRIPFSAVDAALLVAGGGPLLLIGAGLRRRLSEPRKAQMVSG